MAELKLSEKFPQARREDWEALVEKGLKSAGFESLVQKTDDLIPRGPLSSLHDRPDNMALQARGPVPLLDDRPWHIASPVRDPEISFANNQLLKDLEGGTSALRLTLDPTGTRGCAVRTLSDCRRLLDGVYMDLVPLALAPNAYNADYAALLFAAETWHSAHISLGLDPTAQAFGAGSDIDMTALKDVISAIPDSWRAITVNAATVHEAGGTEAQELAYMAAAITFYMRELGPDSLARHINVELTTDQDGHLGLAKIRAARRMIDRIAEAFGAEAADIPIHVISSKRMMQAQDPWTNILRVCSAAFGAICGGANYITARPFTDALGAATPFGYRIARNIQLMMMEESHMGQVNDPAYGSYTHERLTEDLAGTAWIEFQAIESGGGLNALLSSGAWQRAIEHAGNRRTEEAAPILGVTLHPAPDLRKAEIRKVPAIKPSKAKPMDGKDFAARIEQAKDGQAVGTRS